MVKDVWGIRYSPEGGIVTIEFEPGSDPEHLAQVQIRWDVADGELVPVATGIMVYRTPGPDGEFRPVMPRDVQRLPLTKIRDAALITASTYEGEDGKPSLEQALAEREKRRRVDRKQARYAGPGQEMYGKIRVPRGRPERGKSLPFYKEIAEAYRDCKVQGRSPAKTIAQRKHVDENTVYTWIHRARELKLLEPPPASQRRRRP
jgi:hypothetical protein